MSSEGSGQGWRVTLFIALIGALGGVAAAVILTILGNILSGAPQAPGRVVYAWNMGVFAVFGAVFSPILAWSMLRRLPLWRAVAEPALAGVLGTVATFVVAPALFPLVVPATILAAAWRLNRAYRADTPTQALIGK
jgi:hypothetical protein